MSDADILDRHDTLYVTDAELIRRMGVPEKIARQVIRALDENPKSGFPPKIKLWGNRRYWPDVRAYLDATSRRSIGSSTDKRGVYVRQTYVR